MGFEACWERVRSQTDIKKQNQLAKFLDIRDTSVSGAKFRDNFPVEWAFKVGQHYKLNTDWILTGEGPMKVEPALEEGQKTKYGGPEKTVESGKPVMGESEEATTDEDRAHRDLDDILQLGNTYQRGAVKGYLNELSAEISEQIKRGKDKRA